MEFLFGMVIGGIVYHFFNNPDKAKELKGKVEETIEQHKK